MTVRQHRWGQLTYSSFDRNDGRGGGWQVKDTTGDLTGPESELLRGRVQTQFDVGIEVPRFPTPAETDELPRRLIYAPARVSGGETALWHHVPAGTDVTGRPGNVFAHVVLDRHPDTADAVRPIERWRSPDWLTPFGPEAVVQATLRADRPPQPGPLNRRTMGSWLFAPRQWRMRTLAVLLDAVRAAMAAGPMVVIGVEDVDEGANWIAAVSFAMSAGTARRLFFSTFERPATLTEARERGLHLTCVRLLELPELRRHEGIVVIDPGSGPELGDLDGEPHRTHRGDRVRVSEWSVLISDVFADAEAMTGAVEAFDEIAHTVGDSGLDPAWPAAAIVAGRSRAESRREATRVLTSHAPPQLRSVPKLYETAVGALRQEVGRHAEADRLTSAWQHLQEVGADREDTPASVSGELAVQVYAELALADEPWLANPGPARLPSSHYYSPVPEASLVRLAGLLVQHISPFALDIPGPTMLAEARAGLHFVELALRLGLAHDETLAAGLFRVCQESLVPVLLHGRLGPELAGSVEGSIARETRHWLWGQLLGLPLDEASPPGQRIAPAVLDLVGPGPDDPDPLAATWAWLVGVEPATPVSGLIGEYAWHRVGLGDAGDDARFFAARASVAAYARTGDAAVLSAAGPLLIPAWSADRLRHLMDGFGAAVPAEWAIGAIAGGPMGDDAFEDMCESIAERPQTSLATEFAGVRGAVGVADWVTFAEPEWLPHWLTVLAGALRVAWQQQAHVDPELLRRANGLVVLALLAARGKAADADHESLEKAAGQAQAAVAAFPGTAAFTTEEVSAVVAWCDRHEVDSTALAEQFLLADPRSALRSTTDRVAGWVHSVSTGGPESAPVTAVVLAARLSRSAESRDRVSEEILRATRTTPGSSDERARRQAERFLAGWVRQAQTGRVRR